MSRISFMSANYVAQQLDYNMTGDWMTGDKAAQDHYRPLETFRERFDRLLSGIRAMGFDAVDLWCAHLHWSWATPVHIAIAVELLQKHQLRATSYAGSQTPTLQDFESLCKLASALGIPLLAGGGYSVVMTHRADAVALLKKYRLKWGIENHPEKTPEELLGKIGDGGQGTIGAVVDTGWFGTQGCDALQAVKKLGKHILQVHLKDVLAPGAHHTCRYGSGCVPIGACVLALETQGYQGGYSVEHEPEHHDPTADCVASAAMLRNWVPGELKLAPGTKRLRIGVVGCGNIAGAYFQSLLTGPKVHVIGVADIDSKRADTYAAKYGVKAYRSVRALLADPTIELVVNLTIHQAHRKVITQCLNAGKHVHSEKPLTLKYKEAKAVVELAKKKNLRLGCSPFTFMGEAQQTAWKLLREGRLGRVRVATAEVNWGRLETWHPNPAPFYEVGALFDVGVYSLTLITTLFGPAKRVWAYGQVLHPDRTTKDGTPFHVAVPDYLVTMIELVDGPLVRLTTSFYVHARNNGVDLHGDLGSLHVDPHNFDKPVEFAEFRKPYAPVPFVKAPHPGVEWGRAIFDIADAIAESRPHRATGAQAAHVVEICCAAHQSLERNKPVEITSTFDPPKPMDWAG